MNNGACPERSDEESPETQGILRGACPERKIVVERDTDPSLRSG